MKKPLLKISLLLLIINFSSCKKEVALSEFKYAEKGIVVDCDKFDLKLLNEALFSFENDILNTYSKDKQDLSRTYSQFIRNAVYNRIKYEDIVSKHSLEIFEVLKSKTNLWDLNNTINKLNYNSPIINCISEKLQSNDLKRTLNALISTNSMSTKLFGPALVSEYHLAKTDKYLATYIALDLFYAKLFDIDLTKIKAKEDKKEEKVDFNKLPQTPKTETPPNS